MPMDATHVKKSSPLMVALRSKLREKQALELYTDVRTDVPTDVRRTSVRRSLLLGAAVKACWVKKRRPSRNQSFGGESCRILYYENDGRQTKCVYLLFKFFFFLGFLLLSLFQKRESIYLVLGDVFDSSRTSL